MACSFHIHRHTLIACELRHALNARQRSEEPCTTQWIVICRVFCADEPGKVQSQAICQRRIDLNPEPGSSNKLKYKSLLRAPTPECPTSSTLRPCRTPHTSVYGLIVSTRLCLGHLKGSSGELIVPTQPQYSNHSESTTSERIQIWKPCARPKLRHSLKPPESVKVYTPEFQNFP